MMQAEETRVPEDSQPKYPLLHKVLSEILGMDGERCDVINRYLKSNTATDMYRDTEGSIVIKNHNGNTITLSTDGNIQVTNGEGDQQLRQQDKETLSNILTAAISSQQLAYLSPLSGLADAVRKKGNSLQINQPKTFTVDNVAYQINKGANGIISLYKEEQCLLKTPADDSPTGQMFYFEAFPNDKAVEDIEGLTETINKLQARPNPLKHNSLYPLLFQLIYRKMPHRSLQPLMKFFAACLGTLRIVLNCNMVVKHIL